MGGRRDAEDAGSEKNACYLIYNIKWENQLVLEFKISRAEI